MEGKAITKGDPQVPADAGMTATAGTGAALPQGMPAVNITSSGGGIAAGIVNGGINLNVTPEALALALRMLGTQQPESSHAMEWASLSTDLYNVFVVENEKYESGSFCIGRRVALRYTPEEYREHFRPMGDTLIAELLDMPCLFAVRNLNYKSMPDHYPAFLGKLKGIQCQGENIRFSFTAFAHIRQQFINENIRAFGLLSRPVRNQLDEEHWSIRSGSLLQIAADMGIEIK